MSDISNRPKKQILMVDDELEFVVPYAELLRDEGIEVTCESNVDAALELLKTRSFDLILLDMLMPPSRTVEDDIEDLDLRETGVWLYHAIRDELGLVAVPLIFITAVRDSRVREQITDAEDAREKNRVTFLTKPVSLIELLNTVQKNLNPKQG